MEAELSPRVTAGERSGELREAHRLYTEMGAVVATGANRTKPAQP